MYVKLFEDILDSTLWMDEDSVLRVFLTLLLIADPEGFVEIPIPALAQRARVPLDACKAAIEKLESPDEFSRTSKEEGRRIIRVTDEKTLWQIVNFEYYRKLRNKEQKQRYNKFYMRRYRASRKKNSLHGKEKSDSTLQSGTNPPQWPHTEAEEEEEVSKKTTSSSSSRADDDAFVKKVVLFWEENGLRPQVRTVSKARRSAILARKREHTEDAVWTALKNRAASNFLNNIYNEGSGAPIDFVFGPKNFPKVADGNYNDRKRKGGPGGIYDSTL